MSKKRFYMEDGVLKDMETGEPVKLYAIDDLLNYKEQIIKEQHDEIINWTKKYVKLKEENEQLREINKELGDDLYNCRLNKNIIREKLKLWQDVHKEYGIYSIKDFEESFELDAKINKEKGI